MKKTSGEKVHDRVAIDGPELGLSWLAKVTALENQSAVRNEWHTHKELELFFFLKGESSYEIDTRRVKVPGGSVFVIPAGVRHRAVGNMDEPAVKIALFIRPGIGVEKDSLFSAGEFLLLRDELRRHALVPLPCPKHLLPVARNLLAYMEKEDRRVDPLDVMEMRLACFTLFLGSVRGARRGVDVPSGEGGIIREAIRFLESRFSEPISISDLVSHIGYGHSQLFTLFKKETGVTPNDYLLRYRIQKAKSFLVREKIPVFEIAKKCGFSASPYFCHVFKRYTGYEPLQYRKEKS